MAFEWNHANEHLEKDAAKRPSVHWAPLSLTVDDLRRLVIYSTNESVSSLSIAWLVVILELLVNLPCISKVNDFDIEELVKHDVLRLQVSMHHALLLEVLSHVHQLSEQDLNGLFRQVALGYFDKVVKCAVSSMLEHKIEVRLILKQS